MNRSHTSNRCYRLYIGNGNWVNLNKKSTSELLDIFAKGEPSRYQLTPGLFIDIIPHDVDFNSTNADMMGLMRADLVYEHAKENDVQQGLSTFVHGLLNEQSIIDVFPLTKSDPNLPPVTALPTHRHLSLIPSTSRTVCKRFKSKNTLASKSEKKASTLLKKAHNTYLHNANQAYQDHSLLKLHDFSFDSNTSSMASTPNTTHTLSSVFTHPIHFESQSESQRLPSSFMLDHLPGLKDSSISFWNPYFPFPLSPIGATSSFNCLLEPYQDTMKDEENHTPPSMESNTRCARILDHFVTSPSASQQCLMDYHCRDSPCSDLEDATIHENFKYIFK